MMIKSIFCLTILVCATSVYSNERNTGYKDGSSSISGNQPKMDCDSTCIIPQEMRLNNTNIAKTEKNIGTFNWGPKCGPSAGSVLPNAPDSFLCETGVASQVSTTQTDNETSYNWICKAPSGSEINCSATKREQGVCGASNGTVTSHNPSNLCSTGGAIGFILSGYQYKWYCQGNYGVKASCSATYKSPEPVCTTIGYGPPYTVSVLVGYREVSYPTMLVCGQTQYYCEPIYQDQTRRDPIIECN